MVLLTIYLNDLFIECEIMKVMESMKDELCSPFAVKDLGII